MEFKAVHRDSFIPVLVSLITVAYSKRFRCANVIAVTPPLEHISVPKGDSHIAMCGWTVDGNQMTGLNYVPWAA